MSYSLEGNENDRWTSHVTPYSYTPAGNAYKAAPGESANGLRPSKGERGKHTNTRGVQ